MISVLLTLLKIIGIVLLILLGFFLLLLVIVLFVPVRYRIRGYYKNEFVCRLKASWLLHIVSITVDFNKELITSFKIFGIDISSLLNRKKDKQDKAKENENDTSNINTESDLKESKKDTVHPDNNLIEQNIEDNNDSFEHNDSSSDINNNESLPKKKSILQKIRDFFINLKNKLLSVYNKITEIIQNIKSKKESVERYIQILKREEVKGAFSLCKNRIFRMIKHLLPKKMKINAHIGMEDPSVTGYLLAFYSVLPEKLQKKIVLKADFDEDVMEGDFNLKGSCNAIRFLYEILCIITNKNCRTFYKLVKKEISNERK